MYCSRCGKELSDNAYMCPACGEPTLQKKAFRPAEKPIEKVKHNPLCAAGFVVSLITFIINLVWLSCGLAMDDDVEAAAVASILMFVVILPCIAGLALTAVACHRAENTTEKVLNSISLFMGVFTFLYYFITASYLMFGTTL